MSKKRISYITAIILSLTLLAAGCGGRQDGPNLPTGTVEAREVDVNAKIPGRVIELLVEEGDEVKPGQIVARLDEKDLRAREKQALAQVEAARAQLQKAQTALRVTEETAGAGLERARAALERARAEAELAAKTLERMEMLFDQGAIPQQQLDEARARAEAAKAAENEARAAVAEAEAAQLKVTLAGDEVEAARAQYQQAKAALEEIRHNLAELAVKAPAAGTVTAVNVEEGELVSTGMPLITVTDFKDNWVEMQVSQDAALSLRPGQKATVMAGGKKFKGEISRVGKKPSFATRRATNDRGEKDIITYEVRIRVNDPALRPGMNVEVKFEDAAGGGENAA